MKKFTGLIILIGLSVLLILVLLVAMVSATIYKSDVDQDYGFYRVIATDSEKPSTILKDISYINKTLNINMGDTIIWINDASPDWPLTIISNEKLWGDRDGYLRWNYKKFNYTFNEPGVYSVYLKECRRCQNQTIIVGPIETATSLITMIKPTILPTPISTPITTTPIITSTTSNKTPGFDIVLGIMTLILVSSVYKLVRR